jgi:hypothetical protein
LLRSPKYSDIYLLLHYSTKRYYVGSAIEIEKPHLAKLETDKLTNSKLTQNTKLAFRAKAGIQILSQISLQVR